MSKKKTQTHREQHDIGRGVIRHNAIAALVTSSLFASKQFKPKKGKGSYCRKKQGKELYQSLTIKGFGKALFYTLRNCSVIMGAFTCKVIL
ncbi:hypothetical protein VCHA53O466_50084 [Vibrio chagasii]|nr:hypothetical protein VCHA53O466_50084 [Vibrio chagasii]